MTTETPTEAAPEIDDRQPLLDLSKLVDRRDFIVDANGKRHYLRTDGLGAIAHHKLVHYSDRHDELFRIAPDKLTDDQAAEMADLCEQMVEIILDAPKTIRDQIKGDQARRLVRLFQTGSQQDGPQLEQQLAQMAALAQALQSQSTEETSTTES